ncbi:MAG: hypothetical protein QNJ54_22425 [Prochloraceae cyanobacterium]|nr:hypothetical protein [Prochloraceae cyanobacterium]
MQYCPICHTEYYEGQGKCSSCAWDLSLVSVGDRTPQEVLVLDRAIAWARTMWQKYDRLKAQQTPQLQPETQSQLNNLEEQLRETIREINNIKTDKSQLESEFLDLKTDSKEQLAFELSRLNTQLQQQLASLTTDSEQQLVFELSRLNTQLQQQLASLKTDSEQQLVFEVSRLNTQLQQQLTSLKTDSEQQLISQLSRLNTQLQQQFISLKTDSEQQLQSQLSQIKSNTDNQIHLLQTRLKQIENFHQEIKAFFTHNARVKSKISSTASPSTDNQLTVEDPNTSQSESEMPTKLYLSWEEHQLVEQYNNHLSTLLTRITEVSETQKSISDRSAGASQTATLEKKSRGIYGILSEGNINYLVPSKSFRITDSNYQTVEALFECRNYQKGYSERFNLLKPATVIALPGNQNWQLQERGILGF